MEAALKKLPLLTLLLWLLIIAGYKFLPGMFLLEIVQYPLVVILSIFLPVSLWIAVQEGRRIMAAMLAGIFLVNAIVLLLVLEQNYSAWRMLERETLKGVLPEVAAFLAENPAKGRFAAQHVYRHHGVAVPFMTGQQAFAVYEPDDEDKKVYRTNFNRAVELDVAAMNTNKQLLNTFLLLGLHASIFILLLIFLLIYEQGLAAQRGNPEQVQ
jgi:hypothetical protein